jgi:hypothetical protein
MKRRCWMLELDGNGDNDEAGKDGTEEEALDNDKADACTQMWVSNLLVSNPSFVLSQLTCFCTASSNKKPNNNKRYVLKCVHVGSEGPGHSGRAAHSTSLGLQDVEDHRGFVVY